jgi:hypothetical protein
MIMDHSTVYRPVAFTRLVVVSYLSKDICLRVVAKTGNRLTFLKPVTGGWQAIFWNTGRLLRAAMFIALGK